MDIVDDIIRFETGEMEDEQEVIEFFDALVKTGIIRGLQGSYQRAAGDLIEAGIIPL
jgi:hypothetical protein